MWHSPFLSESIPFPQFSLPFLDCYPKRFFWGPLIGLVESLVTGPTLSTKTAQIETPRDFFFKKSKRGREGHLAYVRFGISTV
jgi:hypothetical protein